MNLIQRRPCRSVLDVVLANAGKTAEEFFEYKTKDYFIKDMNEAAAMIRNAIFNDQKITVVGDYDADGVTSSAILKLTFDALGGDVVIRLPKRFSEGYGLSEAIIDEIDSGLLITVDNGIVAVDAIKKAKDKGLKVIVVDHHLGPDDGILPPADILIDPNAIEDSATFNTYCGAGLSYKLAEQLLGSNHPLMKKIISLAAIGTIADVMPLIEDNRNIVEAGLRYMVTDSGRTSGLAALLSECAIEKYLTAKSIAFSIAPAINAPGRLMDDGAMLSYELLSFEGSRDKATTLAKSLIDMNNKRKLLATEGTKKVEDNITVNCLFGDAIMTVYEPKLPEGLVGIFAGRIAEKYGVPCIILTDSENPEVLKGSARSAGGVHLKNVLDAHAELLVKYGGHAEAAGLSVKRCDFERFRTEVMDGIECSHKASDAIYYDLEITADQIIPTNNELEQYAPYGVGNPEIVFSIKGVPLVPGGPAGHYSLMGDQKQHLRLFSKGAELTAFGMAEKFLSANKPMTIDVVGTLTKKSWHSKITNQVEVIDFEAIKEEVPKTSFAADLISRAQNRHK